MRRSSRRRRTVVSFWRWHALLRDGEGWRSHFGYWCEVFAGCCHCQFSSSGGFSELQGIYFTWSIGEDLGSICLQKMTVGLGRDEDLSCPSSSTLKRWRTWTECCRWCNKARERDIVFFFAQFNQLYYQQNGANTRAVGSDCGGARVVSRIRPSWAFLLVRHRWLPCAICCTTSFQPLGEHHPGHGEQIAGLTNHRHGGDFWTREHSLWFARQRPLHRSQWWTHCALRWTWVGLDHICHHQQKSVCSLCCGIATSWIV